VVLQLPVPATTDVDTIAGFTLQRIVPSDQDPPRRTGGGRLRLCVSVCAWSHVDFLIMARFDLSETLTIVMLSSFDANQMSLLTKAWSGPACVIGGEISSTHWAQG